VRESYNLIRADRATPCGVIVALDRMERGVGALSAVQEVEQSYNIPVISIATLDDLVSFLKSDPAFTSKLDAVDKYRQQYGVRAHA
jgi:orotate phosphoribosyltransferase